MSKTNVLLVVLVLSLGNQSGLAQNIPAVGGTGTFEAATWNIEWFGNTNNGPPNEAIQFANVLEIIRAADIDLWAVQEISSPATFHTLLDSLGAPYAGFLATESVTQRIGFIYKSDIVSIRGTPTHILESFSADFAGRPPLQFEADLSVGDISRRVTFITVHMKAFADSDSYNKRAAASNRLKNHIDFTSLSSKMVFVLGDFNDRLTSSITSGRPSPYANFVQDTDGYTFLTMELEQSGRNTFCFSSLCGSGSTIDQLLVTNELAPLYEPGSADHFIELVQQVTGYTSSTSDHLPTFALFNLSASGTNVDEEPASQIDDIAVYPNPGSDQFTLRLPRLHGDASLRIYDLLGQLRSTQTIELSGDRHEFRVSADQLEAGRYLIRVSDSAGSSYSTLWIRR